jgi:ketoreductase RED2
LNIVNDDEIARRVAVVTGSTSGIGLAIARDLESLGYSVVLNSRHSVEAGMNAVNAMSRAAYLQADVSRQDDAQSLAEFAIEKFGRIDALINNAGRTVVIPHHDLAAVDQDLFVDLLQTNLVSAWNVTRACADALQQTNGSIINVASLAGIVTRGSCIPYSVSKAGLVQLTKLLARALAPRVRVNAIAPGFIETPMVEAMPETRREWIERSPLQACGSPDDITLSCRYLLEAQFVTGEVLVIDGGMHLG